MRRETRIAKISFSQLLRCRQSHDRPKSVVLHDRLREGGTTPEERNCTLRSRLLSITARHVSCLPRLPW
jgi:hypothetical protein